MKQKMIFLIAVIVMAISASAQMSTPDRIKIHELDKQIGKLQRIIDSRNSELIKLIDYTKEIEQVKKEIDSIKVTPAQTVYGLDLKDGALKEKSGFLKAMLKKQSKFESDKWKIDDAKKLSLMLDSYKASRELIFKNYISDSGTLKELGCIQSNRLFRGLAFKHADRVEDNEARREDLTFEKLKSNRLIGDSLGLTGIIINKYFLPVNFKFTPLDGGESKSILVGAGKMVQWKLITGTYIVTCSDGGRQLGQPTEVSANSVLNRYVDKVNNYDVDIECHWYAYMPSR